jgi:hypothetical protein
LKVTKTSNDKQQQHHAQGGKSGDDITFVPDEETRSLDQHPPAQKIGHKELDSELAKEMNELSMAERDELLRDIHGVNDHIEETLQSLLRKSLLSSRKP